MGKRRNYGYPIMNSSLQSYIRSLISISDRSLSEIAAYFEPIESKKGDIILLKGKISHCNYFLESGVIRSYTFDTNGNEVTTNLFVPPYLVTDLLSLFKRQPSQENFESLTDCMMYRLTYENLQICFHQYPEFREFGRMALVLHYSQLHHRMISTISEPATKRYLDLISKSPLILQFVPLKIIASYLGITDTSLSRIRKEFSH